MKASLHTWLRASLFGPLLVGIVATVCITIIPLSTNLEKWASEVSTFSKNSVNDTTMIKARNMGAIIGDRFDQIVTEVSLATTYTRDLLLGVYPTKPGMAGHYRTYYGIQAVDPSIPPLNPNGSPRYSTTYKHGVSTMDQLLGTPYVNRTSLVDDMFQAISRANPLYTDLYLGTVDGLFRTYPPTRLEEFPTFASTCAGTQQPTIGYDPRCRAWYYLAVTRNMTIFTPPYLDAVTNKVICSVATPIQLGPTLFGVMAFDFKMEELDRIILNNRILRNGYSFLADRAGKAISHPKINRAVGEQTITNLEPDVTTTIWTNLLTTARENVTWTLIQRQDRSRWYTYSVSIPSTNYVLVMLVPEADTQATADALRTNLQNRNTVAIIVVITVTLAVFLGACVGVWHLSNYFTKDLREFSAYMKRVQRMDPDVESGQKTALSHNVEFRTIGQNLSNIAVAMKLAEDALYKDDRAQAMKLFDIGEVVMRENHNRRGLGVCHNNKAFIYQRDGNHAKAEEYYRLAIDEAESLVKHCADQEELRGLRTAIGNRKMNLGVLYQEMKHVNRDRITTLYTEALELHRKADNVNGITQVMSNLSQLLIREGKLDEAERIIRQMVQELENRLRNSKGVEKIQQLMSFAYMNLGILEYHKKHYGEALQYLGHVVLGFPKLQPGVSACCLGYVGRIADEAKGIAMPDNLRSLLTRNKKWIQFVLDISGSMAGDPIASCRVSMKDVVDTHMDTDDKVGLITFNSNIYNVLAPIPKGDPSNVIRIKHVIDTQTNPGDQTALYDALCYAFGKVRETVSQSQSQPHSQHDPQLERWIIALTDGEDNQSADKNGARALEMARTLEANLIIIMVGTLKNEDVIRNICKACRKGFAIRINQDEIGQAFQRALSLVGQVNVESL